MILPGFLCYPRDPKENNIIYAKSKGKRIGRPRTTKEDIPTVFLRHYEAYCEGRLNISELARVCGLSRSTVYKYLKLLA